MLRHTLNVQAVDWMFEWFHINQTIMDTMNRGRKPPLLLER